MIQIIGECITSLLEWRHRRRNLYFIIGKYPILYIDQIQRFGRAEMRGIFVTTCQTMKWTSILCTSFWWPFLFFDSKNKHPACLGGNLWGLSNWNASIWRQFEWKHAKWNVECVITLDKISSRTETSFLNACHSHHSDLQSMSRTIVFAQGGDSPKRSKISLSTRSSCHI